jgi:pre-mRNA cleavage complex 2 protein Pcf11
LQANPYDTTSQNHVSVLHQVSSSLFHTTVLSRALQLRKLIEAGVSQEELQQILGQLRTLVRSAVPPPAPIPAAPTQWQSQPPYSAPPATQAPFQPPHQRSYPQPTAPINTPYHNVYENVKMEGPSTSVPQSSTSTPTTGPSAPPPPANIANLLSTLLKAGVVSASGTPLGAGATAKEEAFKQATVEHVDLEREASRAYRQAILSQKIQLTSSDITR